MVKGRGPIRVRFIAKGFHRINRMSRIRSLSHPPGSLKVSESKPRSKWCCTVREPCTMFRTGLETKVGGRSVVGLIRIGELSRDLEPAERERDSLGRLLPNDGKQGKAQTLADAGISTSTANRYEELAGGKRSKPKT